MRIVHLSDVETVLLDIWIWGLIHLAVGYAVHKVPASWLARDTWLFRGRRFEQEGRFYQRRLHVLSWKDGVPEAGALFAGGISKRSLLGEQEGGLPRFAVETRRAELTHWIAMLPGPLFVLWNPPVAVPLMVLFGVAFNLPFILIQRFNRLRIDRILRHRAARQASAAGSS